MPHTVGVWTTTDAESDDSTMAEDLGPFLFRRRDIAGLTHEEVVERARANGEHISVSTLSAIERGVRGISAEMAGVIARALGLTDNQTAELLAYSRPAAKGRELARLSKRLDEVGQQVAELRADNAQLRADSAELKRGVARLLALLLPADE